MMFKKWHITGQNKITRVIAGVLVAVLLAALPAAAAKPTDFTDLDPKGWYYKDVSGAINAGLFNGDSPTYFNIDGNITRAEFVTALSRLCGVTEEGVKAFAKTGLTDVAATDWFYHYVGWAYANGVSDGKSPTEFDPEAPITREEISKMLGSTVERVFKKTLATEGAITFKDQAKISDWAVEWVKKCNVAKIFLGDETGRFNPGDPATRAEAAAVSYRCYINDEIVPKEYSVTVSGFDLPFDVDTDYYLAQPADFENCKILGYTGFTALTVSVEQYAGYYPYSSTAYKLGNTLNLGYGRSKITLTATLRDGTTREYLIALTDPRAAENTYSKVSVTTESVVWVRKEPKEDSEGILDMVNGANLYYLGTEDLGADGIWCKVQLMNDINKGRVGYVPLKNLRWHWTEVGMPECYKAAVEALQAAHPNWSFTFVDTEMTYAEALEEYGAVNEQYINPLYYLTEDKIFAMLDIDTYDPETWNDEGITAIWDNKYALQQNPNIISKADAVKYFKMASDSLLMNPYYIACRAAQESGYGGSQFALGEVSGYKGYYNFFGIQCYDSNPTVGAAYAKKRNWNSVERSIVEGANWMKDQYLDRGSVTPYFFRYASFKKMFNIAYSYMTDSKAPESEAGILKRAYTDPNAKAHFIIPVYRELPTA